MTNPAARAWAGHCTYPGKEPFYLGTIVIDARAKQHEVDAALLSLWATISPHEPPAITAIPGCVFFVAEDGDDLNE